MTELKESRNWDRKKKLEPYRGYCYICRYMAEVSSTEVKKFDEVLSLYGSFY
jgi:hypothetical protein